MAAVDDVSELRIRTPPPDDERPPRRVVKKKVGQATATMVGVLGGFYIVGVLLVEIHRSETPYILLGGLMAILSLFPICIGYTEEEVLPR